MGTQTISAENFSQLYASLETLEVKQIVSTLLEISSIRDEIKKRVTPRKRRTRAMMMADAIAVGYRPPLDSLTGHGMKPKKPRKSTPVKLEPEVNKIKSPVSAFSIPNNKEGTDLLFSDEKTTTNGKLNPFTQPPSISINSRAAHESINQLTLSQMEQVAQPHEKGIPSIPFSNPFMYWNTMSWYRLAASQLMGKMIQDTTPGLIKPTPVILNQHNLTKEKEIPRPLGGAVSPASATAGSLSAVDNSSSPNSMLSDEEASESAHGTQIKCPDCNDLVSLSLLHQHLETACPKKGMRSQQSLEQPNMVSWLECYNKPKIEEGMSMRHKSENKYTFKCENCEETFKNKSSLKRHKIIHTDNGGFPCVLCKKVFAKPELLRKHEALHTEMSKNLWPCQTCGRSFSNKYNLAVHERIHSGERPFKCLKCPLQFRVKCSMQNHMKSKHQNGDTAEPETISDQEKDSRSDCQSPSSSTSLEGSMVIDESNL